MYRLKPRRKYQQIHRKKGKIVVDQWLCYRHGLYSCLLWWAIGAGIGFLFSISLTAEMKQILAEHLENSVTFLMDKNPIKITYFLKRCLTYTQLLILICCLEYFSLGYIGVRIFMLGFGFIYGFSQIAWIAAYSFKGMLLGFVAYCPHHFLFIAVTAWGEWLLQNNADTGKLTKGKILLWILCCAPLIAGVEAYGASAFFKACM